MGQQQLLLSIVIVIVVAATITTGIVMFNYRAKEANRRAIIQDMYNIATLAIAYYKTPVSQGGGGGDAFFMNRAEFYRYTGYQHDNTYIYTENGQILIIKLGQNYFVVGYGKELGYDEENAISGLLRITGDANAPILTFNN